MAIDTITTVQRGQETCFSPKANEKDTPLCSAFNNMLKHFKEMNTAELRIETAGLDVLGPELLQKLRVAECAREATIEAAYDVIAAPDVAPEDRGLRRLAVLLTSIFQAGDDEECQRLLAQCDRHRDIFDVVVTGPAALRAHRLHIRFFEQLDFLTALQEFGATDVEDDCWPDFPDLVPV